MCLVREIAVNNGARLRAWQCVLQLVQSAQLGPIAHTGISQRIVTKHRRFSGGGKLRQSRGRCGCGSFPQKQDTGSKTWMMA